jgi:hypothetical protein
MNNFEIRCKDSQTYLFAGLHEASSVKELITLAQQHKKDPKSTYGFTNTGSHTVHWEELANPSLLVSATLPGSLSAVLQQVEQKETILSFYQSTGLEDVNVGTWVQMDGFRERSISYKKWISIPVLGKNVVSVIERQRLFQLDGKFVIAVFSDLGKTPYAKCFCPLVQVQYIENGDKVEYLVKFEMIWTSSPFVKGIIQNKTQEEIREIYGKFSQRLVSDLGGSPEADDASVQENEKNEEDDFAKTRAIYKIVIICLIVILLLVIWVQHGRKRGFGLSMHGLMTFIVICFFFALLVFF